MKKKNICVRFFQCKLQIVEQDGEFREGQVDEEHSLGGKHSHWLQNRHLLRDGQGKRGLCRNIWRDQEIPHRRDLLCV